METQTTLFSDLTHLAKQFVPGNAGFDAFVQGRRKDLDVVLTVGRIATDGVTSLTSKQVDALRALGEDLRGVLSAQAELSKSEAVRQAAQKAVLGVADLAEVVVNAQSDAFDAVKERAHANVEELKTLLLGSRAQ
ncbi:MAG TPA: phasin family protein [Burkholderiaceae bacterium]|jgi:hypothetical protein|nr:phasin family protein [Burkholderiaceae bacterium]